MSYNKHIELTNLKSPPSKQIKKLVREANEKEYYGVCLLPQDLSVAKKYASENLKLITVAGFPPVHLYSDITNKFPKDPRWAYFLGRYDTKELSKIRDIIDTGLADELDIILPLSWYATKHRKRVEKFLKGVKKNFKKTVKVIIELGTIFRSEDNIKEICTLLNESEVDFLKTNSGLIKQSFWTLTTHIAIANTYTNIPIKASGGIRTVKQAEDLLSMKTVERIGTSAVT